MQQWLCLRYLQRTVSLRVCVVAAGASPSVAEAIITSTLKLFCGFLLCCVVVRPSTDLGIVSEARNPLLDAGIRSIIFSYVGPGYWLFIGQVCKDFKESYEQVAPQREEWYDEHCTEDYTICTNRHTLSRAVLLL
jgi:hypothetical protein